MTPTEISADTRAVAGLLIATPVGELASLAALSATIGRDITGCRHVLRAARKVAQREGGAVFTTERGIGYRRLSAESVAVTIGSAARAHIRRTAGRARRTLIAGTAGANDLPAHAQQRLAAEVSALSLMEHLSRDATVKPAPDAPLKPAPIAATARALLSVITGPKADAA